MFQPINTVDPLAEVAELFKNKRASLSKLKSLAQHLQQHFSNYKAAQKFMVIDLKQRFEGFWSSSHSVLYTEARLAYGLIGLIETFHGSEIEWQINLIGLLDTAFYKGYLTTVPAIQSTISEAWDRYNQSFPPQKNSLGNFTNIWVKQPYRTLQEVMGTYRRYLCISKILTAFAGALNTYPSSWWRDTILNWEDFNMKLQPQLSVIAPENIEDFILVEVGKENIDDFVMVELATK